VSGVVALGLSYAAQLRRHVKAEEVKELLYSTARPIEPFWNTETPKQFYKFVTDLSQVHLSSMNLNNYKGKMGHGQVNAYNFLNAIAGENAGKPMTFPNVFVQIGSKKVYDPTLYLSGTDFVTNVTDASVATAGYEDGKIVIKGLKTGQTKASITNGSITQEFVITVRSTTGNGWL
jgi:hypothetical protein